MVYSLLVQKIPMSVCQTYNNFLQYVVKQLRGEIPTRILTINGIQVDSLKKLQSLIGLLNIACLVVVPGRAIKELFPIGLALEVWSPSLANKKILFMSDNEAIVHVLNKQSCKEKTLMKLIRRPVLTYLSYNIYFKAKHIEG